MYIKTYFCLLLIQSLASAPDAVPLIPFVCTECVRVTFVCLKLLFLS